MLNKFPLNASSHATWCLSITGTCMMEQIAVVTGSVPFLGTQGAMSENEEAFVSFWEHFAFSWHETFPYPQNTFIFLFFSPVVLWGWCVHSILPHPFLSAFKEGAGPGQRISWVRRVLAGDRSRWSCLLPATHCPEEQWEKLLTNTEYIRKWKRTDIIYWFSRDLATLITLKREVLIFFFGVIFLFLFINVTEIENFQLVHSCSLKTKLVHCFACHWKRYFLI